MSVTAVTRWRGLALVLAALVAGCSLSGYLAYRQAVGTKRQQANEQTDTRLCRVLRVIIKPADPRKVKPSDPRYYRLHAPPGSDRETRIRYAKAYTVAVDSYVHDLQLLNCSHLPSVSGS